MFKATCTKNGQLVEELTAPTLLEAAEKVDLWLRSNPDPVTWHIQECAED